MDAEGVLRLTKFDGAGNDFLVLGDLRGIRALSPGEVRALCDRRRGVGADGVLRVTAPVDGGQLRMALTNADGSPAEMSGNGIRCLVHAAIDRGVVQPGSVKVETAVGMKEVNFQFGDKPGLGWSRVDMGPAQLGRGIPLNTAGVSRARLVDMGNPHLVLLGDVHFTSDQVRQVGPALSASIPGGANVEFVWMGQAPDHLMMRVWERGVGETLACGTGTCAAAAAANAWGLAGDRMVVDNPGGRLEVVLGQLGIELAGPSCKIADISVPESLLRMRVAEWGELPVGTSPSPDEPYGVPATATGTPS